MASRSRSSSSSGFFGFSWADEVEREEEQQRKIQIQIQIEKEAHTSIKRKPDPFGAARPREVILEEKGVDWKNLDRDFSFDSSVRECNIKTVTKKKPLELGIQKSRNNLPMPHQQAVSCEDLVVPPLKYAPKNINLVFEEIHRARKLKPNGCQSLKTNDSDQCHDGSRVSVGSNAEQALRSTGKRLAYSRMPHQPRNAQKLPTNGNTLSNLNSVLVKCNKREEKTGSNFEAKSIKENGRKEEKHVERRRVLAELNDSSCKTVPDLEPKPKPKPKPSSNSYFGVLELLEPTSLEKSNPGKWIHDKSARKRSRKLEDNFGAKLEARKLNRDKPPATSKATSSVI